ncbi:MAG TPA: translation initiation factor IF-2, partial [Campylobacterales bacterium]|nr:translation initiation factor IF-2 [Campylobacterales bacterium]
MDRVKIQEIAAEAGTTNAVLIEKAKELGYDVKVANSTVTIEEAGILVDYVINGVKPKVAKPKPKIVKKADVKKADVAKETEEVSEDITPKKTSSETKVTKRPAKRSGTITATPKKKEPLKIVEVNPKKEEVNPELSSENEKIEVKAEAPKVEEPAKEEAVKEEPAKAEATKEETPVQEKPKVKRKRIGITVVKKADREKPKIRVIEERKPVVVERKEKLKKAPTPPSKKKPKKVATAKETGEKLDFMSNSNFDSYSRNQVTEVEEEPEVLMLDFSDKNIYEDMMKQEAKRKEEAKKRAAAGGVQQQNRGRGGQGGGRRKPSGLRRGGGKRKKYVKEENTGPITSIEIPENVRVYEFAEKVGRSTGEVIKVLFTLGTMFTQNDFLDKDSIEILAEEFEVEVHTI